METTEDPETGKQEQRPSAVISGQYTRLIRRHVDNEFLMILVVLRPGASFRMFRLPGEELRDSHVDLEDILKQETREVTDRLRHATGYPEMIAILQKFLEDQLLRRAPVEVRPVDRVLSALTGNLQASALDHLAREACLSPRQLERLVLQRTGIGPRTFMRIIRFQRAYNCRLSHPEWRWLRIAMETGYHDYQHLVRDFKAFTGLAPRDIVQQEDRAPERILGLHG